MLTKPYAITDFESTYFIRVIIQQLGYLREFQPQALFNRVPKSQISTFIGSSLGEFKPQALANTAWVLTTAK